MFCMSGIKSAQCREGNFTDQCTAQTFLRYITHDLLSPKHLPDSNSGGLSFTSNTTILTYKFTSTINSLNFREKRHIREFGIKKIDNGQISTAKNMKLTI